MAYDWGSLGSSLSGYGSVLSSIGNTVTGIMASREMIDISKKYQKRFLFLEQEKLRAQQQTEKELIEIEKLKAEHEMKIEEETEREKGKIFQEWLYAKEQLPLENSSFEIFAIIGLLGFFIFKIVK